MPTGRGLHSLLELPAPAGCVVPAIGKVSGGDGTVLFDAVRFVGVQLVGFTVLSLLSLGPTAVAPAPAEADEGVPCGRRLVDSESLPVIAGALSPGGGTAVVAVTRNAASPGAVDFESYDTATGDHLGTIGLSSTDLRGLAVSDDGEVAVADGGRVLVSADPVAPLTELLPVSGSPFDAALEFADDGRLYFTYQGEVPGTPANPNPMVYVTDPGSGVFDPLFSAPGGGVPDGAVRLGDVAASGTTAVVRYRAANLGLTTAVYPTNESPLAFVDLASGTLTLASPRQTSNGSTLGVSSSTLISITGDGQSVYWRKTDPSNPRPMLRYRRGQTFTETVYQTLSSGSVTDDGSTMAIDRSDVLALDVASGTTQVAGELVPRDLRETRSRAVTRSDGANLVLTTLVGGNGAVLVSLDRDSCVVTPHPESLWYGLTGESLVPEAPFIGSPAPNRQGSTVAGDGTFQGHVFVNGITPITVEGGTLWYFSATGTPASGWGDLRRGTLVLQSCGACPSGHQWSVTASTRLLGMEATGWSVPVGGELIVRTTTPIPGITSNTHGGSLVRFDLASGRIDRFLTSGQHWGLGLAASMVFAVSPGGRYVVTGARAGQSRAPGSTLQPIIYDLEANSATGVEQVIGQPLHGQVALVEFVGNGRVSFSMNDGGVVSTYSMASSRARSGGGTGGGTGPDPEPAFVYEALGDSFASGEGLLGARGVDCGRFVTGTYAQLLWDHAGWEGTAAGEFNLRACSGNTSAQVLSGQLGELDDSVDLVTVSAGGNNVGFAHVLEYCLAKASCQDRFVDHGVDGRDALSLSIRNSYDELYQLLRRIRALAPNASIVLVGYPHIVVAPELRQSGCAATLSDGEIAWIRERTVEMALVQAWAAADAGVTFVNMLDAFGPGGGVCGSQPHLNSITDAGLGYTTGMFHPNSLGHEAFYNTLISAGVADLPLNPQPLGFQPPDVAPETVSVLDLVVEDTASCWSPGVFSTTCAATLSLDVARTGGEFLLSLFSEPVVIDTGVADANGTVHFDVQLPPDTPRGLHTLVAEPIDPGLDDEIGVQSIIVAEPSTPPLDVSAAPGDHQATVTWQPPADDGGLDVLSYRIYRGAAVGEVDADDRSFTEDGLENGTPVAYAVEAVTALGSGARASTSPVTPAPTRVEGTVTDAASGDPVTGAFVAVLRTSDFGIAGGSAADGSGHFLADVPPGDYFLYLIDPAAAHTARFHGAPSVVTVTEGTTTVVDPTMASTRGSITATVTDASTGTPIEGVWGLALSTSTANTGATEQVVTSSGSAGRVDLTGLAARTHYVGYVDPAGAHATRFFPDSPNVPDATRVTVTAGNATTADAALPPQAPMPSGQLITGTVTEAVSGEPVGNARVVALRASDYQMVRGAVTDAGGHYTLDLAPGDYKLAFLDSDGLLTMEWYDDQPSTALGDAATVTAPATADAALTPTTGTMTGTVTDAVSGDSLEGVWVIAIGPSGIAGGAVTGADGTYTIAGLPAGTYRATFADPNGGRAQEYFNDSPDYPGATPFAITAGSAVTIDATLA